MLNPRQQRDIDYLQSRRQVIHQWPKGIPLTPRAIARATIAAGAPRYYVSHLRALRALRLMRRGCTVGRNGSPIHSQWLEIRSKVDQIRAAAPWLDDNRALARLLSTATASRYFLTENYAMRLASPHRRHRRPKP